MTSREKQIILGTVLGGSSIVKTSLGKEYYLMMRGKNLNWIRKKAGELSNLAVPGKCVISRDGTNRWNSRCYPEFQDIRKLFYNGSIRSLKSEALDQLMDIGLATWYLDCGILCKNKVILNTNIWGKNGNKKIVKYFKIIDFEVNLTMIRKSLRLELTEDSSKKFLKLISHFISELDGK